MRSTLRALLPLLALTLLTPSPAPTAERFTLEQLLGALAIGDEFRSDYRERRYTSLLTEPVTARGELVFRPPDHLEKRTIGEAGHRAELIIDGGEVTLRTAEDVRRLAVDRVPELAGLMAGLRAIAAGDAGALRQRFEKIRLQGGPDDWQLTLGHSDGSALADRGVRASESVTVVLAGAAGRMQRMTLERGNQRVVLELEPVDP